MKRRNLSGVYIFHQFDTEKESLPTCLEDCPEKNQDEWLQNLNNDQLKSLVKDLSKRLREIGDQFDIVAG